MLAAHFFSKCIKTQITLPYQWLNITFNGIRFNLLSTSNSSSSDSDSDSDSDSFRGSNNRKKLNTDYLYSANAIHKRRQIGKQLTKTALLLSNSPKEDKSKILTELLSNISNIQNEISSDIPKSTKQYKKELVRGPSVITMLKNQGKMMRNVDKKVEIERKTLREPSITRLMKSQGKTLRVANDEVKTEQETLDKPYIMRLFESKTKTLSAINDKVKTERKTSRKPYITRMTKNRTQMLRLINDEVEAEPEISEKPFTIRTPKRQLEMKENIDDKFEMKQKISKSLFIPKKQGTQKMVFNDIDDDFETKYKTQLLMKENKSVISLLRKEQFVNTRYQTPKTSYKKIFDNEFLEAPNVPKFKVWDTYEEQELQSLLVRYPRNALEEMIKWTKEGKLWKFPIDNEQGMEKEQSVHFSKHVFLESHLSSWCPSKGPLRHFMELVCVGLSKNPYMTIEEKYSHIMWYKDFFKDKQDLLEKLGLVE